MLIGKYIITQYCKKYSPATQPKSLLTFYKFSSNYTSCRCQKKHLHYTISKRLRTAFSKHLESKCLYISIHSFLYKQHFYKQRQAEIGQKIKQMLSNTLRRNFCCMKIIHILHAKIIEHIIENKKKNKCVWIHDIVRLIITKMKMKLRNRSHRYDINRPRSRHGPRYSKYKKCLQHLSNIWSSIHEKVKQHWGLVEKKRCL